MRPSPQKNSAKAAGPVWLPMVIPMGAMACGRLMANPDRPPLPPLWHNWQGRAQHQSVRPSPPEEQRKGARAGVADDGCPDGVDPHGALQVGEAGFHRVGNGAGVPVAHGVADAALPAVGQAALGVGLHHLHNALHHHLLPAQLLPGLQLALGVHVQQRAHHPCGFGDPPAPDGEAQVGGIEPVVHAQAVVLQPLAQRVQRHALVPHVRQGVHDQPVASGGPQGIHDHQPPLRAEGGDLLRGQAGGVDGAGQPAGKLDVQHVQPLRQQTGEIPGVLGHGHLGGLHLRPGHHAGVQLRRGDGQTHVIGILLSVQGEAVAYIADIPAGHLLPCQVGGGAAAEDIGGHQHHPPVDRQSVDSIRISIIAAQSETGRNRAI